MKTLALLLDNETTGLFSNRSLALDSLPEIIEIYMCLVNLETGKVLKEYETLIKPKKDISAKITEITTITNDMLKDAPPFAEVADKIVKMIEKAPRVIAHNASYDKDMIEIELERLGRTLVWPRTLCTVEQTIHMKGHRLSLTRLHQLLFNEPFAGAHRAKDDVKALTRCCVELHKREML